VGHKGLNIQRNLAAGRNFHSCVLKTDGIFEIRMGSILHLQINNRLKLIGVLHGLKRRPFMETYQL
jgi:hypothetical protein